MNSTGVIALFLLIVSGLIGYAAPSLTWITASAVPQSQSAVQAGFGGRVKFVALSPDGRTIVAVGDQEDTIKFWNTTTGEPLRTPEGLTTGVNCIAFNPDGKLIASGEVIYGRRPRVWDAASGKLVLSFAELRDTRYSVYSVAFSPDGKIIASGSDDHTIRLWDAVTGTQLRTLGGPVPSPESATPSRYEIPEQGWQHNPKIMAIRKIVNSVNAGLRKGSFKTAQRKCDSPDQYFALRRIARDSKRAVKWYEEYGEGEDSSSDYHQYYDSAQHLRFALIVVYAANGTREQHRVYFDENGKLIRQSRRLLKGPGYFAPARVEELVKQDPAKEFASDEDCKEIKPQPKRQIKKR